jgi:predicted amidohydrolase
MTKTSFNRIYGTEILPYTPFDKNGNKIYHEAKVVMPDPEKDDFWQHGDFIVTVADIKNSTGNLIVYDADGDYFEVEPNRVGIVS